MEKILKLLGWCPCGGIFGTHSWFRHWEMQIESFIKKP